VCALLFLAVRLIRGTAAAHAMLGAAGLVALFYVADYGQLRIVSALLGAALPYVVFAAIVVFQGEIRRLLTGFGRVLSGRVYRSARGESVSEVAVAARALAAQKTGALVVFERDVGLRSFTETGVRLDAAVSYDLLCSIFTPGSPLHDGAVVIQADRVAAAACFLPLTVNPELSRKWGSRHRAAIGITEDTDAVALVVSEETGHISVFAGGALARLPEGAAEQGETLAQALADVLRQSSRRPAA
jgi:diadenylate cyclase